MFGNSLPNLGEIFEHKVHSHQRCWFTLTSKEQIFVGVALVTRVLFILTLWPKNCMLQNLWRHCLAKFEVSDQVLKYLSTNFKCDWFQWLFQLDPLPEPRRTRTCLTSRWSPRPRRPQRHRPPPTPDAAGHRRLPCPAPSDHQRRDGRDVIMHVQLRAPASGGPADG